MDVCDKSFEKIQTCFFSILFVCLTICSGLSPDAFAISGKTVFLFDGETKKTLRTRAASFDELLFSAGIKLGKHDTYWTSSPKVEEGAVLVVERAVPVTIKAGGKSRKVYTTQQTVQGVVNDAGFNWENMMPVEDGFTKVKKGMVIHVAPYTKRVSVKKEALPVTYTKWYDPGLAQNESAVIDPGQAGEMKVTVEEYVVDGKVVRTDILGTEVLSEGQAGAMRVGTREETAGTVMRMTATAYHPSDGDGRGITATGTQAGYGTVAVDPAVIPLGASVFIPGYGEAVASDTGGAIIGNRIDLCMETFGECYDFGVRKVDVYIAH